MAGVDAYAHTLLVLHPFDDAGDVLETPAQIRPLPRRVLDDGRHPFGPTEGKVNLAGNLVQALLLANLVQMTAGMEIQHPQTQQLRPLHLVEESGTALQQRLLVGRA